MYALGTAIALQLIAAHVIQATADPHVHHFLAMVFQVETQLLVLVMATVPVIIAALALWVTVDPSVSHFLALGSARYLLPPVPPMESVYLIIIVHVIADMFLVIALFPSMHYQLVCYETVMLRLQIQHNSKLKHCWVQRIQQ